MTEQLGRVGNASSLHASGRAARRVAEQSRERLAEALGARPSEVLFTGGGTESDNLAVKGLFWARRQADSRAPPDRRQPGRAPRRARQRRVAGQARRRRGHLAARSSRPAGSPRRRSPRRSATAATSRVASVMWANNEIGTVSDIAGAGRGRARGRRPAAHRRGAGGRAGAGRLRRQRRRRADHDRAQARRPDGRRRAAAAPRRRVHAAAARRRPGARRAVRHARRRGDRRPRGGRRSPPSAAARSAPPRLAALRDRLVAGVVGRRCPTRSSTAPRWTTSSPAGPAGCPATRTCPSPAPRATRC